MKNIFTNTIKWVLSVAVVLLVSLLNPLFAQNGVYVGATPGTADPSAMLDVVSPNKGFLMPRVDLVALNNGTLPINAPSTGLLVYNLGGGGVPAVGLYYWDGAGWVQLSAGALSGSGTTNTVAKWTSPSAVGNSQIIDDGTNVGIGVSPTAKLEIGGTSGTDGIKFPDGSVQKYASKLINSYFAMTGATPQLIKSVTPTVVTGLSITITPKSANSKFMIMAVLNGNMSYVASSLIYRNNANVLNTTTWSANSNGPGSMVTTFTQGANVTLMQQHVLNYMDAPGTTAAVTYDIRYTSGWSGTANDNYLNNRSSSDMVCPSTLTILEFDQ